MSSRKPITRLCLFALPSVLLIGCPDSPPAPRSDAGSARLMVPANKAPANKVPAKLIQPPAAAGNDRFLVPLGDSPHGGAAAALVTAVLFGDLTDPATARLFAWLRKAAAAEPGTLRWVFKHYPSVRPGDTGMRAAQMAVRAARGGRFEAFAAALLDDPKPVDPDRLEEVARTVGMKPGSADPPGSDAERIVIADRRLAARLGVRNAPGLFFNGRRVGPAEEILTTALEQELAVARGFVEKGIPVGQVYDRLTRDGRRSAWLKIRAPVRPVTAGDGGARNARGPDDRQTVMVPPGAGLSLGPAGAPVEFVVFIELGCSLCARILPMIEKLHGSHPKRLHISVRLLPDRRKRAGFIDSAVLLMALADRPGALALLETALKSGGRPDALRAAAARSGVDDGVLAKALAEPAPYLARLDANRAAAERAGVRGSPYLFVNGRPIPGLTNLDRLERMIGEELARSRRD